MCVVTGVGCSKCNTPFYFVIAEDRRIYHDNNCVCNGNRVNPFIRKTLEEFVSDTNVIELMEHINDRLKKIN
jgi:hypothetical protein